MKFTIIVLALVHIALAADPIGCYSSVSGKSADTDGLLSSLKCADLCPDSPYVAVGDDKCYCLDSKPSSSDEVDSSKCDSACNYYPQEMCGGDNVFNVYKGQGEESASSAAADSVSASASSTSSTSSSSSTALSSSSLSSSSTEDDKSSTTEPPSSSSDDGHIVITSSQSSGSERVITVTKDASSSTAEASSTSDASNDDENDDENDDDNDDGSSTNVGAIAGGVVGGVAGVAIIALLAFFLIKRRRQQEDDEDEEEYFDKPIQGIGGAGSLKNSGTGKSKKSVKTNGLEMPMTNPFTHPSDDLEGKPNDEMVDPRLNPVMLGRRRLSEGSLADETDYSRKILQVANPDD